MEGGGSSAGVGEQEFAESRRGLVREERRMRSSREEMQRGKARAAYLGWGGGAGAKDRRTAERFVMQLEHFVGR